MINVKHEEDNTFTISWDENDPQECLFNDWTEKDFINAIQDYLHTIEESTDININQVTEAVNQINDHIEEEVINTCEETFGKECYEGAEHKDYYEYIDQTAEEVNQDLNTLNDWFSIKEEAIREYQSDEQQKD